jgi:predicted restriction endonuclease
MGFNVPDSNCPEAVALRSGAGRGTATLDGGDEEVVPFSPGSIEEGRRYTLASIVRRQGQGEFRAAVLRAYGFACAITGCDVLDVLEAAHIVPYRGAATNHVQNGILLRADLHVLFDVGLLDFDARWRVRLDESLRSTTYGSLEGKPLRMPKEIPSRPSPEALALREENHS